MAKRKSRRGPSDPQDIHRRKLSAIAAHVRAACLSPPPKQMAAPVRDPSTFGVNPQVDKLETGQDVTVVRENKKRGAAILHAKRSDAFSLISLSDAQASAAKRYTRDWMIRAGIQVDEIVRVVVDNAPGLTPGQHVSQRMIDAGRRIEQLHGLVGPAAARLLSGLVEPLVMHGEVRVWRVLVQQITGETERHAQAAAVRMAVQSAVLCYPAIDQAEDELKARRRALRPRYAAGGDC